MIGWIGGDQEGGWINQVTASLLVHWDEQDMDERIERAWLARVLPSVRRRLIFHAAVLLHYPLTQPQDICQRCLRWTGDDEFGWQLDHIVELQFGGIDHPANLVRLCVPCHKQKPLPPPALLDDAEAMRAFVVAWIRRGPPLGRREPFRAE